MYKLSDIISKGGNNDKINKFINRYVVSKKEKEDIIEAIKNKNSSSDVSSSNYIYLNVENLEYYDKIKLIACSNLVFISLNGEELIVPSGYILANVDAYATFVSATIKLCIDLNLKVCALSLGTISIKDFANQLIGINIDDYDKITEEEFYSI